MASDVTSAALRFLKIRPRSIFELGATLKRKGFDVQDIDQTLAYLIKVKLLNDRVFANEWIRYRLARPFGFVRIIRELKEKGISPDIIEQSVLHAQEQYVESDVALELAKRKASQLLMLTKEKRDKRIFDFLIRRGFKVDDVIRIVKKLGNT